MVLNNKQGNILFPLYNPTYWNNNCTLFNFVIIVKLEEQQTKGWRATLSPPLFYNKAWRSCGTESKIALLSSGYRLKRIRQLPRPPVFRDVPLKIPYIVSFCCRCFFRDHYEFGTKIGKIQNRFQVKIFFQNRKLEQF